jgi:small conductance mechanosensitive channel
MGEKTMETNGKKSVKSSVIKAVLALVVLAAAGFLGNTIGVFEGMDDFSGMIKLNVDVVVKLIVMIAFVTFLCNFLLMFFRTFQNRKGRVGTLSTLLASLIRYGAVLVGFCWGLTIIGVNVSTVFASVGIIALILGFGAESLVADMVTGVFIIFENQYNVGDIIEVGGFRGTVQEIGFRTIRLVDAGGNIKIINNSRMIDVVNLSDKQSAAICEIGVSYSTDLEKLETKLPEIFVGIKEKYKEIFIGEIKYLGVEELADSCVKLKIKADVNEKDLYSGRRILNKELKMAFDREKITIPFPQMDVHTN